MKKSFLKNFLFLIGVSLFCINVYAQGPADPGNDPIISSNERNQNIGMTEKREEKNNKQLTNTFQNLTPNETVLSKIRFSYFSLKTYNMGFKTSTFFSKANENKRRVKLIMPEVLFTRRQI